MQNTSIQRIITAAIVVMLTAYIIDIAISLIFLSDAYDGLSAILRSQEEVQKRLWLAVLIYAFYYLLFAILFVRLYGNPGDVALETSMSPVARNGNGGWLMDGVWFGLFMGSLVSIPAALQQYLYYPLPLDLVIKWIASGLLVQTVAGIIASAILHPREK